MSQPPIFISEAENRTWCIFYGLESAAIIIGNLLIIAAFAITKSLHKKTYLLLISLAVADLLVGAVALPMFIHLIGGTVTNWWAVDDHVTHTQTAIEIFTSYASIFFWSRSHWRGFTLHGRHRIMAVCSLSLITSSSALFGFFHCFWASCPFFVNSTLVLLITGGISFHYGSACSVHAHHYCLLCYNRGHLV
ncbi:hypothetical protein OS493_015046 [Desmophyllum pertusum]|uniref:G-protein coupled receptors family 1 profile domain-containing protein n=1 Tax=Desmophyllum pertusum TaxID=174260 RepID=A0A9W9ZPP3_9CNID|nr:hypothetical protein OS493_015046 [Desmophyllum pertusum]